LLFSSVIIFIELECLLVVKLDSYPIINFSSWPDSRIGPRPPHCRGFTITLM